MDSLNLEDQHATVAHFLAEKNPIVRRKIYKGILLRES